MRSFLIAFACLSTLVLAQNVVVAAPMPTDSLSAVETPANFGEDHFVWTTGRPGGNVPEAATMLPLGAGLVLLPDPFSSKLAQPPVWIGFCALVR